MILVFGVSPSFGDGVSVEIHARWTPDLTASPQQAVCVKNSGTVAGGVQFHLIANCPQGVSGFTVDSFDIQEVTDAHQPWHYHQDGPLSGTPYNYPPYDICSSPPTGNPLWFVCPLNVPIMTFSFHNTTYTITANYHYTVPTGNPPPWSPTNPPFTRVPGTVSASFTFDNLIVQPDENTVGKILKWDPDNPSKSDTTLGYIISSAQKKKCRVVISIYNLNGGLVYQRILDDNERQLCPGNYTFTWDGTNNQLFPPTPNYAPKGLYTFDIKVEGVCPYDTDHIRSDALSISQVKVLKPEAGTNTYELKYVLSDTKQASQAGVIVFDPNLENKADAPGDTKNTPPGAQEPVWNEIKSISADIADITGDYSFVFWGIDDHPEIDKAHRKRPTLEMLANDSLGASANFGTSSPDVIATTLQAIDDAGDEQEAVYLQVEVLGQGNATKYDVRRQGKYTDWKWWNGSDFQKERKVKIGATAQEVIKGLKRVDVFSWLTHAIEDGRIALWDGDTFIAADHSTDDWFQSKFGSNFQDRVVYISDLSSFFKPPLSKLKCAFIINCSSDRPLSTVMAETIKEKGAQFVGTLVGGTVRAIVALKFIDWFWHYATKGKIKEIKDGSNPNTVRRRWEMCSLVEAMDLAWGKAKKEIEENEDERIRNVLFGSRLEPKPLGNAYLGRPPLRAWSDEELKRVPLP